MTVTVHLPDRRVRNASFDFDTEPSLLCLGDSPALSLVLSTALAAVGGSPEPGGVLVACADWPPAELLCRVRSAAFQGKAAGLIVVSADMARGARTLALLRALVCQSGGFPVGAGLCVDATEVDVRAGEFSDVTIPASLALLGRRVRVLARGRRILRAA